MKEHKDLITEKGTYPSGPYSQNIQKKAYYTVKLKLCVQILC